MLASHLNQAVLKETVERAANRMGFGNGLVDAALQNERVVALCADLTESTRMSDFAEKFPKRFIEMGIAEQSMASVASGMAAMGKIPFMASYAMFSPGRNWEQIRTTIAYNGTNVKIVGAHAGVSVGPDGATHQATEDIALMRVIPRMTVLAPCDIHEAQKATLAAAAHDGPVYIRLSRGETPVITTPDSPFTIGKAEIFFSRNPDHKKKVGIISTGTLLNEALRAVELCDNKNIGASVMHVATIKPLDEEAVLAYAQDHDVLVTIEEHQCAGGLGSAVAEYLSTVFPKKIIRVGIPDAFGQSGTPEELIRHYRLDAGSIVERLVAVLA